MAAEGEFNGDHIQADIYSLGGIDRVIHSPARLMLMTNLYIVDKADYLFLMNLTGLTWGNLSSHLSVLEEAGYVNIDKKIIAKKTKTMIQLTEIGRNSFKEYKNKIQKIFGELPD